MSLSPRRPTVEEDGLVCDPCGRLYPMIGYLSDRWVVGMASPKLVIDEDRFAAYDHVITTALAEGVREVSAGTPVNWWTLFHDRLEQAALRIDAC